MAGWTRANELAWNRVFCSASPSDDQRRAERIVGLFKLGRHFTQCANVPELVVVVY